MKFHDAHCHISNKSFLKDFDLEISMSEWKEMGLEYVIGVSTKLSESNKIIELAETYDEIIPTIGIHPWKAKKPLAEDLKEEFKQIASNQQRLIIGEIGLDYHFIRNEELYPHQVEHFEFFLDLSEKRNIPVNIHLKGAEESISGILSSYNIPPHNVLIHWYTGSTKILEEFIERDYYFTINPSILGDSPHISVLKKTSINRILTESDGNVKHTIDDKRIIGSPGIIPKVVEKIAEVTKKTNEEIVSILHENFIKYVNF